VGGTENAEGRDGQGKLGEGLHGYELLVSILGLFAFHRAVCGVRHRLANKNEGFAGEGLGKGKKSAKKHSKVVTS